MQMTIAATRATVVIIVKCYSVMSKGEAWCQVCFIGWKGVWLLLGFDFTDLLGQSGKRLLYVSVLLYTHFNKLHVVKVSVSLHWEKEKDYE